METIRSKFDTNLAAHIQGVNFGPISRVELQKFEETSTPHIDTIELVTAQVFRNHYAELYMKMFHGGEREKPELIVDRLDQQFAGKREHLTPYRVLGIRDGRGDAIAAAQFSVLYVRELELAVPYLQYIYTRPENRGQYHSELLHTLVLAVAVADAQRNERNYSVPFTMFETEPPCHGDDDDQRATAEKRTQIHSKSGSVALMLQNPEDGRLVSAHVQPGLDEVGDPPVTLTWALRANPTTKLTVESSDVGRAVIASYYDSLRDEGFAEENIVVAERLFAQRLSISPIFRLIPLAMITREMSFGIDEHEAIKSP